MCFLPNYFMVLFGLPEGEAMVVHGTTLQLLSLDTDPTFSGPNAAQHRDDFLEAADALEDCLLPPTITFFFQTLLHWSCQHPGEVANGMTVLPSAKRHAGSWPEGGGHWLRVPQASWLPCIQERWIQLEWDKNKL